MFSLKENAFDGLVPKLTGKEGIYRWELDHDGICRGVFDGGDGQRKGVLVGAVERSLP